MDKARGKRAYSTREKGNEHSGSCCKIQSQAKSNRQSILSIPFIWDFSMHHKDRQPATLK